MSIIPFVSGMSGFQPRPEARNMDGIMHSIKAVAHMWHSLQQNSCPSALQKDTSLDCPGPREAHLNQGTAAGAFKAWHTPSAVPRSPSPAGKLGSPVSPPRCRLMGCPLSSPSLQENLQGGEPGTGAGMLDHANGNILWFLQQQSGSRRAPHPSLPRTPILLGPPHCQSPPCRATR